MVLVAFGLMIVRRDVASQAIGFLALENAISLAALVAAASLPLILETAFLFDLLVAIVVFGMLIRAHRVRAESLSTADLTRLQGGRGWTSDRRHPGLADRPLAAGIACAVLPTRAVRVAAAVTVASGIACFGLVLALVPATAHWNLSYSYLRVDAVSAIFLLATGFLYAAVAIYSVGYLKRHEELYARRFYAGLNLFAWAMLAAPLMSSLALLWIAVEVTTIISALLVAIEDADGAAEAAWKYLLIASSGLSLALLATVFAYYAGSQVLGEHYNLAIGPLIQAGAHLSHTPVRLAFLLTLLGYGTKVGLVPVHAWLPDAHSEGPHAGLRAAVRVAARGQLLRDPAVLPVHRRLAGQRLPAGRATGVRSGLAAAGGPVRVRPGGHQAPAGLLQHRAHGHPGRRVSFGAPAAAGRARRRRRFGRPHPGVLPLARLRIRWEEVDQAFGLIRQAAEGLPAERTADQPRVPCEPASGRAAGWAEAPQGEVIYDVALAGGRIVHCHPRSASFHNLVLMHEVFAGDILTDFPFIEASFGLSVAGVAL
jgi:hypothetical protein